MAEAIKNQQELHIQIPLPGQSAVLAVDPDTTIYLDFPMDQADVTLQQDGNLVIQFDNGAQVELQGFDQALPSSDFVLEDGKEISADQFVNTIHGDTGEPAAGATPPSGGTGEYHDDMGNIADGIDRLGTLGPREFGGSHEEPHLRALNAQGQEEPPSPPPPPEPPQALDDHQNFLVDTIHDEENNVIARFYDIHAHGNVLDNDSPDGIHVTGFSSSGLDFGPDSLGHTVVLPSGAQFTLSSDGTYQYDYDNRETLGVHEQFEYGGDPITIDGGDNGQATLHFTGVDPLEKVGISWFDGHETSYTVVRGYELLANGGEYDILDQDGIDSLEVKVHAASVHDDIAILESVDLVDTNASLSQDTIHYTIADGNGMTSSADLIISFADTPSTSADNHLLNPTTYVTQEA
ncbi:MAG: hypothetical protein JRJ78_15540 [Deltaproteobacteria bacterium]|nr:hypothetical protein [Deltaproteobacteria bacterium]